MLQLLRSSHKVCVYDNLSSSSPIALERVGMLANAHPEMQIGDVRDANALSAALMAFRPDAVIHFAGLKAVGDSTQDPLDYYSQNVSGSLTLLKAMAAAGCTRIIFSSSATPNSSAVILRYFNPVGADASGMIVEDPFGVPNNLLPFIAQVAVGRRAALQVFGDNFDTRDGTGERDYIHVEDLARAHIAALDHSAQNRGCEAINLGSGQGVTVLEMLRAFEQACGKTLPYEVVARRDGDVARMLATVEKSSALLKWKTRFSLEEICTSTWNWQSRNLDGYAGT